MFQEKINNREKDAFRKKTWRGVMPTGTASFPKINKPDSYQGGPMKYSADLVYEPEMASKLEEAFDAMLQEAFDKLPKGKQSTTTLVNPVKPEMRKVNAGTPEEDYEPTGNFKVKSWTYADDKEGKRKDLPVLDSAGNILSRPPDIHGGSQLNISVSIVPYWMQGNLGLTLYLNAVQIVELSAGYSDPAADFKPVDGGWTATDSLEEAGAEAASDGPF